MIGILIVHQWTELSQSYCLIIKTGSKTFNERHQKNDRTASKFENHLGLLRTWCNYIQVLLWQRGMIVYVKWNIQILLMSEVHDTCSSF